MRDGSTREIEAATGNTVLSEFLSKYLPALVILSGDAKGTEYAIDSGRVTLGRGPGVDLAFDDGAMSRAHVAIEFTNGGFRLLDLGSTNGMLLNGGAAKVGELKHGDKFQIGEHTFQFVVQERRRTPTYVIEDD